MKSEYINREKVIINITEALNLLDKFINTVSAPLKFFEWISDELYLNNVLSIKQIFINL